LVNHVMNKFTTAGLLQTSRPLPLIQAGEWDGIMARVHDHIEHRARPKLGGMNARLDGVTRELLMADQQFFFRLIETTLSRPQEIADLKWTNVFEINGRIFLHCPQGKTSAARRTIDVGLLHPGGEGYRELIQEILQRSATRREPPPLFEAVSRHYRGKKAHTKNPSRYLRSATGRADLKVYDLRHNGLIQVLGSALDDRLRHGNFHSWLCLLSVSMGHQALSVTLNTYIGTAAHVFNV
jgi:integrase